MAESMKRLIAGNWKMNKTTSETKTLIHDIISMANNAHNVDIVVCPSFTSLESASKVISSNVKLGAQNFYPEEEGAFTGEISAKMLKDLHVSYIIIGHSERREYFKETNQFINKKVLSALKNDLIPILCVGETEPQRKNNETFDIVKSQIIEGLHNITHTQASKIVIAYEPIWAIGTGETATPQIAQEVHNFIRNILLQMFGQVANQIKILYGGSMKPENAQDLLKQPDINGGLIGGASLKADSFYSIVSISNNF